MINSKPLVSVLIPAYNCEDSIKRCLDSIKNQSLKEIEVIVVNDGSTDNTIAIIEDYIKDDDRFYLISKYNTGYGDSLNRCIRQASGKYIAIVETDDYIKQDMYENLYNIAEAENVEVVKSNYALELDDVKSSDKYQKTGLNIRSVQSIARNKVFCPRENPSIFYLMPSVWSSLYKKSYLEDNDIYFVNTPQASFQDRSFVFKVYVKAKRVIFVDENYYVYCAGDENSSTKQTNILTNFMQEMEMYGFLMKNNLVKDYLEVFLMIQMQDVKFDFDRLDKSVHQEYINVLSSWYKYLNFYKLIDYENFDPCLCKAIKQITNHKFPDLSFI